ncbi:DUF7601 domain-containing protein [Bilifractor sp. LCP19S3_H10]|uniref:DUF7601 domain-containing protein n=1 Tax=Bilifractor sp. LCP19S3_H10 TaxID=3438736 RepID=UPI003F9246EF
MKGTFLKKLFCLSCCMALGLSAVPISAEQNPDSRSSVIDPSQTGTVVIDYQDTIDGNDPVTDAEFTFYKIADLNMQITAEDAADLPQKLADENATAVPGSGTKTDTGVNAATATDTDSAADTDAKTETEAVSSSSVTDTRPEEEAEKPSASGSDTVTSVGNQYISIIPDLVIDQNTDTKAIAGKVQAYYKDHPEIGPSYTGKTGEDGKLAISGMELGVYLGMETSPAPEHYASTPFLFQLPYSDGEDIDRTFWNYELKVEPKSLPAGDIVISKQVSGSAGDTNQKFNFVVTFKTTDADLSVPYKISNGTKGTIKTGDKIQLKSGEIATITMIPCGSDYKVTEVEANQDGYKTTSEGASGRIVRKVPAEVKFVNRKDKQPTPTVHKTGGTPTGDTLPILYMILAAASVCVIGIVLFFTRRRKKK